MVNARPWLISLLFFASGATGLVYEILWVRQFGLLFGSTIYSAALVTGIFVCGLGFGGYLVGRWADARLAQGAAPLRSYGLFEIAIGVLAAGIGLLLPLLGDATAAIASYETGEHGWLWLAPGASLLRYLCAAALMLPVTFLMGGTLTLLIRDRVRDDLSAAGWDVSVLYGVNTAGAALGCLLTDTWLVPELGIRATQGLAVGTNLLIGLGALALAGRASAPRIQAAAERSGSRARFEPALASLALALALGGFAAMAFQIVWFRYLVAFFGGYRPVFSSLLTCILIGIWLGSLLGGALARRLPRPGALLGLALAGFAITALAALSIAPDARDALAEAYAGTPPWSYYGAYLRAAAALVLGPALLSGAVFPLASALALRDPATVGARAGLLYLANTLGGVLGSLVAGFALLPRFGMQATAALAAAALALAVVALLHATGRLERASRRLIVAALCAALLALVAWQRQPAQWLLSRTQWLASGAGQRVLAIDEGVSQTVAVVERPGPILTLFTNGFSMSGTGQSAQRYMRAFAHVPLLIADGVERVLVMCYGVGNTTNAVLLHPAVEQVDVVDVSAEILEQAHHFAAVNGSPLSDPRVRVHVNDARLHLRMLNGPTYDLITGEPPPIAEAGVVSLYSREFFELARSRLRPGGFVTYWLPIYQVGEGIARAVVRAFVDVFPDALLLSGHAAELVLIGRLDAPIELDPAALQRRIDADPALRDELRWIGLDRALDWVGLLAGSSATLAAATHSTPPVTDDRPSLEYGSFALRSDRRLPADLFSLADLSAWCPSCDSRAFSAREREELDGSLEVISAYYRSPAFLQPTRAARFAPRLSAQGRRALARSRYLRELTGTLVPGQQEAALQLRHGQSRNALESLERALAVRPNEVLLRLDLADLRTREGRTPANDAHEAVNEGE